MFFFDWVQAFNIFYKRWVALIKMRLRRHNGWYGTGRGAFANTCIENAAWKTSIGTEAFVGRVHTRVLPQFLWVRKSQCLHTINICVRVKNKAHGPAELYVKRIENVSCTGLRWKLHAIASIEHVCPTRFPQTYIRSSLPSSPNCSTADIWCSCVSGCNAIVSIILHHSEYRINIRKERQMKFSLEVSKKLKHGIFVSPE